MVRRYTCTTFDATPECTSSRNPTCTLPALALAVLPSLLSDAHTQSQQVLPLVQYHFEGADNYHPYNPDSQIEQHLQEIVRTGPGSSLNVAI